MDGTGVSNLTPDHLPFTDEMLRVLADARAESHRLRHEFLGTEHLVLVLTNPESVAGETLARLGIDRDQVCGTLGKMIRPGSAEVALDAERPFTTRTKKAFDFAADSARESGHTRIGLQHMIVGLMRERMNPGAQVLAHHGLTADKAAAAIPPSADNAGPG